MELHDQPSETVKLLLRHPFIVMGGVDSDGDGLPDVVEAALGLDPHNSDTDGNGIPDGMEDFDKDGLPNAAEVFLGNPDTNNNGIKDGDEDTDGDGLTDSQEIRLGANPRLADGTATAGRTRRKSRPGAIRSTPPRRLI
jgi:Bacterial TSP3 repeat